MNNPQTPQECINELVAMREMCAAQGLPAAVRAYNEAIFNILYKNIIYKEGKHDPIK